MLLILPKPAEISGYHTLAVNLENYDEISISKNNETNLFTLAIIRQFDAHGSNQSTFFYVLGAFKSVENCLELFQRIIDALNAGKKTFELPDFSLPVESESASPKDQRSGFL